MEVRDPIHGAIYIPPFARSIIEKPIFQRLRRVRQLGFTEHSFPGATHTRFLHSLGAFHLAYSIFERWMKDGLLDFISKDAREELARSFSVACLCHDLGHPPYSHALEKFLPFRHELMSAKLFEEHVKGYEFVPDLLRKEKNFKLEIEGYDFTPLVLDLLSGDCDVDRMDYLLRDSYFCGVAYGSYDLHWILSHLKPQVLEKEVVLTLGHKAVGSIEDFLLSRYHMFSLVYLHHRGVILEHLTREILKEENFKIDINNYVEVDDQKVNEIIKNSQSKYKKYFPRGLELIYETRNEAELPQDLLKNPDIVYHSAAASLKNLDSLRVENNHGEFKTIRESSQIISGLPTKLVIHRLYCAPEHSSKYEQKLYNH